MARLVFLKILDRYPQLKIIGHHLGAMVPFCEGRSGLGFARQTHFRSGQLRLAQELEDAPAGLLQAELLRRHDGVRLEVGHGLRSRSTASITSCSPPSVRSGAGHYIRETLAVLDSLDLTPAERDKI
jgi:hypothetical protein